MSRACNTLPVASLGALLGVPTLYGNFQFKEQGHSNYCSRKPSMLVYRGPVPAEETINHVCLRVETGTQVPLFL